MSDDFLAKRLFQRKTDNAFRKLRDLNHLVDFSSNDYLGFARSTVLRDAIRDAERSLDRPCDKRSNGSTGSRLISGNLALCEQVEAEVAQFHRAEAGLLFNSGYDANLGLLAAVPQRGDTVIYDELVHASIRDGMRLGFARAYAFRHNDLSHLEERLRRSSGERFVIVESVYSMNGDTPALQELVETCRRYEAKLIIDEAHATGVIGETGAGLVNECALEDSVFARIHTFGKGLGVHGAVVLGSNALREYLINFARSFIYTTALPPHSLLSIRCAYRHLRRSMETVRQLHQRIHFFLTNVHADTRRRLLPSHSAIQSVTIPGNNASRRVAESLQTAGYDIRPILSPTVPAGEERIRICLHAFNRLDEIKGLAERLHHELVNC
jgi:8-amino-7-oxononanoate synthase